MGLKLIDVRWATRTNKSARFTIPIDLIRHIWKAEKELKELREFAVCILKEDNKIVIEVPENLVGRGILSSEDEKRLIEAYLKHSRVQIGRFYTDRVIDVASFYHDKNKFQWEKRNLISLLEKRFEKDVSLLSKRELHFVSAGRIAECMASIFLDFQEIEEERVSSLIEDIQQIKNEYLEVANLLKALESSISQGLLSEKDAREIREFLKYRSQNLRNYLEKIKSIIGSEI